MYESFCITMQSDNVVAFGRFSFSEATQNAESPWLDARGLVPAHFRRSHVTSSCENGSGGRARTTAKRELRQADDAAELLDVVTHVGHHAVVELQDEDGEVEQRLLAEGLGNERGLGVDASLGGGNDQVRGGPGGVARPWV